MALYLDLPVYKVCNELYLAFVKIRRTLPRMERYTIGQELDRAMVETLVLIQRINSTRDKVPLIIRARQLAVEIQVRMRALRDVRVLSISHFTELFDLSENLSKQLFNWQRFSQKNSLSDANKLSIGEGRSESVRSRSNGANLMANSMMCDTRLSVSPNPNDSTPNREVTS